MSVESESESGVTHDVVDGAKAVIGAANRDIEQRMVTIAVEVRGMQLEHTFGPDSGRQLLCGCVWLRMPRGDDPNGHSPARIREHREPTVNLITELGIRGAHDRARRRPWCFEERVGDEVRVIEVDTANLDRRPNVMVGASARPA